MICNEKSGLVASAEGTDDCLAVVSIVVSYSCGEGDACSIFIHNSADVTHRKSFQSVSKKKIMSIAVVVSTVVSILVLLSGQQ